MRIGGDIGSDSFIPGLGLPDENMMKGPLLKEGSILEGFVGERGLSEVFNKDVLEDAKNNVIFQFQYLYGSVQFNVEVLAALSADGPALPIEGGKGKQTVQEVVENSGEMPEQYMGGWFKSNMIVSFTMNMMDMNRMMLESELVELSTTMTAMLMILEFAHNSAQAILRSAEKQAAMYQLQAIQGILTAVGGFTQIVMAVGAIRTTSRSVWDGEKMVNPNTGKPHNLANFAKAGGVGAMGSVFQGLGATINGFGSANLTLEKAEWDAYKVIQDALRQIFQQLMESSLDAREEIQAIIKKAMDQLAQLTSKDRKAAGINPHSGSG